MNTAGKDWGAWIWNQSPLLLAVPLIVAVWGGAMLMPPEALDGMSALLKFLSISGDGNWFLPLFMLFGALRFMLLPSQICRPVLNASRQWSFWFDDYQPQFNTFAFWKHRKWKPGLIVLVFCCGYVHFGIGVYSLWLLARAASRAKLRLSIRNSLALLYICEGFVLCLAARTIKPRFDGPQDTWFLLLYTLTFASVYCLALPAWLLRWLNSGLKAWWPQWAGPFETIYEEFCSCRAVQYLLLYLPTFALLMFSTPPAALQQVTIAFLVSTSVVSLILYGVCAIVAVRTITGGGLAGGASSRHPQTGAQSQ